MLAGEQPGLQSPFFGVTASGYRPMSLSGCSVI